MLLLRGWGLQQKAPVALELSFVRTDNWIEEWLCDVVPLVLIFNVFFIKLLGKFVESALIDALGMHELESLSERPKSASESTVSESHALSDFPGLARFGLGDLPLDDPDWVSL